MQCNKIAWMYDKFYKQILFSLHCKKKGWKSYGKREERFEIHDDNFIKHKISLCHVP